MSLPQFHFVQKARGGEGKRGGPDKQQQTPLDKQNGGTPVSTSSTRPTVHGSYKQKGEEEIPSKRNAASSKKNYYSPLMLPNTHPPGPPTEYPVLTHSELHFEFCIEISK